MLNGLLIAANSFISLCYFTIAFLIFLPFIRGQQKTALVLATILVFFSCALGHGGHVLLMAHNNAHQSTPLLLFQVGVDLITAIVAATYIALRRYYSLLIDGPLLLSQAQDQLAQANAELTRINASLESQVKERTDELLKANQILIAEVAERKQATSVLHRSNALLKALQEAAIDGILVVDENNEVVLYNQLFHQIWQIPETVPSLALQIISEEIDCNFLMADLSRLLSSMKVGAERIRSIILSLRTFSRLDEADLKAVNLHEGIESALLFLQSRLKTKAGKEIQVIKEYGDLPQVECYPGKLNQVFMNVLCNAIDALELGSNNQSPTILLRTWVQGQRVAIAIADNGVGISESIRERIFEPFFTTKPIGQGTGIGLSISYQVVVEKHGGSFKFTSELGQGTEFLIEIPLSQN